MVNIKEELVPDNIIVGKVATNTLYNTIPKPYISFVVTTRNDDHGGHAKARFQYFLDHLSEMCDRHSLRSELIVVEWNPVPDRPPLAQAMEWPKPSWLNVRIITVPKEMHDAYENSDKFPLFQMIGKNVGIRRSKGEFVLATNIDLLFSDELFALFAHKELDPGCFYRMDRHDISGPFNFSGMSWEERLGHCRSNVVRIHGQHGTYKAGETLPTGDPNRLHTNACGDFTLMAREKWIELKAYPEYELWSIFIDGLLIHAASALGMDQKILRDPLRQYHMEHGLGWAVVQDTTRERPSLDYNKKYIPLCEHMIAKKKPLDINHSNWGLADHDLQEYQTA